MIGEHEAFAQRSEGETGSVALDEAAAIQQSLQLPFWLFSRLH